MFYDYFCIQIQKIIMDILKARIMQDGKCYPGGILKVDSFINHQMDSDLMMEIAKEFIRLFKDKPINKVVTIEASGIAPAIFMSCRRYSLP